QRYVHPGRYYRSYHAVAGVLCHNPDPGRAVRVHRELEWPYSERREPAWQPKGELLYQSTATRRSSTVAGRRPEAARLVVGSLAGLAQRALRRAAAGAARPWG